jgi:D-alanyl-lipoteichoic acid acyltransferase DltB (MBOAT superfamily)
MLFNSYIFIFGLLPAAAIGFFLIGGRGHHRVAIAWLVAMSLLFYGWWNPAYIGLILFSILFNYGMGVVLGSEKRTPVRWHLALGVAVNLGLLGYYKYANFFVDNVNALTGASWHMEKIVLPLAISFFTFQQIAFLVDAYRGETREYNFLHYCLFVTFFPQLIAGPIVHHKEMLPQFGKDSIFRLNRMDLAVGLTIFTLGLFKKVIIADEIAQYVTPAFTAADRGEILTFFEAWGAALSYTLQLYFDFSGYSDMAIGIGRMFGIRLPLNFNAPYKAANIIEFWRRWHMTLSRFLRDYLYIPLGGSRKGPVRRYANLMITMVLGGLWHGAAWTFVMWGTLHGAYLGVNHAWQGVRRRLGWTGPSRWWGHMAAVTVTFLAVVVGWVFFRAETFGGALAILEGMSGANGVSVPPASLTERTWVGPFITGLGIEVEHTAYFDGMRQAKKVLLFLLIVWLLPTTQQIMAHVGAALETYPGEVPEWRRRWMLWRPNLRWAALASVLAVTSLLYLVRPSEFLYYQF